VWVERPDEPDRLLTDATVLELNRRLGYMPYWAYIWPGAYLLAEAVADAPEIAGARVLEIGCGLGMPGLVALQSGAAHVSFSDYDQAPLDYVATSAARNGIPVERYDVRPLDWRTPPDETFDMILGADVLYERGLVPLIAGLVERMLTADGMALFAGPYRVATEDLSACLEGYGLFAESGPVTARDEHGQVVRGTLQRVRRQPQDASCPSEPRMTT
jgi:predicted nicotinamide N-methyase